MFPFALLRILYYFLNMIFSVIKTPADKWKDALMQYKKQCQNILKLSSSIRYVGVINAYGRTLTGIVRSNIKPMLKSEQVKNEFFIISTLMSLRKNTSTAVGKLEHVILSTSKGNNCNFTEKRYVILCLN